MKPACPWLPLIVAALLPALASATTYEVGPGKALASLNAVPWESLEAGDTVLVHWQAAPYKEKFVLCRQGTEAQPIVVRGVPGPGGERPVIDGNGATTRTQLNFWGEERAVVKIGGANKPADTMPRWIVLEGLEIRSGRPPFLFTGRNGQTAYAQNAAAIFIEKGENLVIRNCALRDSGNGLFVAKNTRDLLVEGNELYDNGNAGSAYEHNSYTAATGITFQFNRYGPLRASCNGNNLKDRSVGTVVRYNWIEGGNRNLDLVDAEDDPALTNDPRYRTTFVYGNVLLKPAGGNNQVVHYGGDSGNAAIYRKGTLHFFNNTLVSTRPGNTTLVRLSTNDERADLRNNILLVSAAGSTLGIVDGAGVAELRNNWTKPGWVKSHSALTGTVSDLGGNLSGAAPGFLDAAGPDYRLAAGSPCLDQGAALAAAALPDHALALQYRQHLGSEPRPVDGPLDLGAFESCLSGACSAPDAGAPPAPDASAPPRLDASAAAGEDASEPEPRDAAVCGNCGPAADAGAPPLDDEAASGCGCSASASPIAWAAILAAALLAGGRRRRHS